MHPFRADQAASYFLKLVYANTLITLNSRGATDGATGQQICGSPSSFGRDELRQRWPFPAETPEIDSGLAHRLPVLAKSGNGSPSNQRRPRAWRRRVANVEE